MFNLAPRSSACLGLLLLAGSICLWRLEMQLPAHGASDDWVQPSVSVLRADGPISIDGKLDEPSWFGAPSVGAFHFTWYKTGDKEPTIAKLLWDSTHIYVACICQDAHITARHVERDGPIPQDDCFEIMIAPNPKSPDIYFNIEWNVIGGIVDNFRPNGPTKPRAPKWDAAGVLVAGKFVGTLNDDSDRDQYWVVEVAIPVANFAEVMGRSELSPGDVWQINLNRHGGATNPQFSQWSRADTATPSFHTPHRFGRIQFIDSTAWGLAK